mgnify:CR=1 FL=1
MVDKLIKRKEAAEMLGISLDTLDHARMEGLITYVQYVENGCVYFTEVGLQEYIARSTHRARPKDNNPTFRKKRTARSGISTSLSIGRLFAIMNISAKKFWRCRRWQEKRYAIPQYGTVIMAGRNITGLELRMLMESGWRCMAEPVKNYMIKCSKRESRLRIILFVDHSPTVNGVLRKVAVVTIRTGKSHYVDGLHIESKPAYYKASGSYEYSRCYSG